MQHHEYNETFQEIRKLLYQNNSFSWESLTLKQLHILAKLAEIQDFEKYSKEELKELMGAKGFTSISSIRSDLYASKWKRNSSNSKEFKIIMIVKAVALLPLILGLVWLLVSGKIENRSLDQSISVQLNRLVEVEKNMPVAQSIIDNQKIEIQSIKLQLEDLEAQNQRLSKINSIQRDAVDVIVKEFKVQLEDNKWNDRLIGFILGMIGSLIVSLVLNGFKKTVKS